MGKRASPYVEETERSITDLGLQNSSARILPPHSVILSSRAPIGHLVINTEPMATNQGCKGLVPDTSVDHKYLYYYLTSIVGLLNDLGSGATFKELSGGKLKEESGWNVSREVAVVPVDASRIKPMFLSYLIGSGASQEWLGSMKKGAAYVGINIEDLRLLPVSAPDLQAQDVIVKELKTMQDDIDRLRSIYQRKGAALDELKQSLLYQALSGAL